MFSFLLLDVILQLKNRLFEKHCDKTQIKTPVLQYYILSAYL
jgi:hypothetical protein